MVDTELLGEKLRHRYRWFAVLAALGITVAIAVYAVVGGRLLPGWIDWKTARIACTQETGRPDTIILERRSVRVCADGAVLWQSGKELRVQDVLWCDIDRNGREELLLLCWRQGRYGGSRPFWVEQDEKCWSQHIYIYDWTEDGIRPVWMASGIGMQAAGWRFDETQRLVITDTAGRQSAWDWISWGLRQIA